jgi:hypothetical protein
MTLEGVTEKLGKGKILFQVLKTSVELYLHQDLPSAETIKH